MLKPCIELFVDPVFLILFYLMRVCMCDTLLFPIKFFVSLVRDLNVLRKYWNLKKCYRLNFNNILKVMNPPSLLLQLFTNLWQKCDAILIFLVLILIIQVLDWIICFLFRSWKWWWWWSWSLVFVGFRTILTSFGATLTQQSICRNISR